MAIKGGQFLHVGGGFLLDRLQTGGVDNLNRNEEKIYELGNYETVQTVFDTPDLTFGLESLDMTTEIEEIVTNQVGAADGTEFDFVDAKPLDIISPFKSSQGAFTISHGIVVPYLTLENVTYRFGVRQSATQQFSFRGDAQYMATGSPYYEEFDCDGATTVFTMANTAVRYDEGSDVIYALCVSVIFADGTYKRLFFGEDYTNTSTQVTVLDAADVPNNAVLRISYISATADEYLQAVHPDSSTKPAAVRHAQIDVYVSDGEATPSLVRWNGVTGAEASRRVTLQNDEEFGNPHYVEQSYEVPEVSGSVTLRPANATDFFAKLHQISGVPTNRVIGPFTTVALPMEIRVSHPDTGARLKTIYVPDARFSLPNVQGRANQRFDNLQINWNSDGGTLLTYKGARP